MNYFQAGGLKATEGFVVWISAGQIDRSRVIAWRRVPRWVQVPGSSVHCN
jgi:hypothetical protein